MGLKIKMPTDGDMVFGVVVTALGSVAMSIVAMPFYYASIIYDDYVEGKAAKKIDGQVINVEKTVVGKYDNGDFLIAKHTDYENVGRDELHIYISETKPDYFGPVTYTTTLKKMRGEFNDAALDKALLKMQNNFATNRGLSIPGINELMQPNHPRYEVARSIGAPANE